MASGGKKPREPVKKTEDAPEKKTKGADSADIGDALRTAYEDTVKEDIPSEMLDLLGKLD